MRIVKRPIVALFLALLMLAGCSSPQSTPESMQEVPDNVESTQEEPTVTAEDSLENELTEILFAEEPAIRDGHVQFDGRHLIISFTVGEDETPELCAYLIGLDLLYHSEYDEHWDVVTLDAREDGKAIMTHEDVEDGIAGREFPLALIMEGGSLTD